MQRRGRRHIEPAVEDTVTSALGRMRPGGSGESMSCYVHPKAAFDPSAGRHDLWLDLASDSAPAHLRWVADLLIPYLGASTLEVGAGHGAITQHLARGRRLVATDLSDSCLSALRSRFADSPNVQVRRMDLRSIDVRETFDSVVLINVLEHIHDDRGTLRALSERLNPGGNCLIYVPAFNWLYGALDRDIGHYRRYSKRRLAAVASEAGLQPVALRYVNLLAIPAWSVYASARFHRHDTRSAGRSLNLWDRVGVPVTRAIEQRIQPPAGLNVLCVARKGA
jgi:2-polyprenyl-3-methyl-5-hydroxy-6-metoxy-1,4-benzoquinol methylase